MPGIKTDDEFTRPAAAERRSGAVADSMRYETSVIPARDSSHEYTQQDVTQLSSATTDQAAEAGISTAFYAARDQTGPEAVTVQ